MSIIGSELLLGAAGAGGYEIERSLRFNSADSDSRPAGVLLQSDGRSGRRGPGRAGSKDTAQLPAAPATVYCMRATAQTLVLSSDIWVSGFSNAFTRRC
jgi:hypothetical protein